MRIKSLTCKLVLIFTLNVPVLAFGNHHHDIGTDWSGAEHTELGEEGFKLACTEFGMADFNCSSSVIHRKDRKGNLSYGKVVALGDFYRTPLEAYQENRVIRGLEKVFKCIDEQGKVHSQQETHPDVEYPDCTWVNIFSGTQYLEVLSTNINHFGWYNIKEYIGIHGEAIKLALRAHELLKENKQIQAEYVYNKALFFNAYADHFLTDAFSAGHVRVPRLQVKNWAKKNLRAPLKGFVGDALGNIMHDFDGRNYEGRHVGLAVKNAKGEEWITHCDNHLHYSANANDPVIKIPTQAVSLSVQEIFAAYKFGIEPEGVYTALELVPFANDIPMAEKFQAPKGKKEFARWITRMRDNMDWPLRIITSKRSISKMVKALDVIMDSMASDIQSEVNQTDEVYKRMPEEYKQKFMNVE